MKRTNNTKHQTSKPRVIREQSRKDNKTKRINLDNERDSKLPQQLREYLQRRDSNDISWYTKNTALFEASTRVTWATIQGLTKPFPGSNTAQEIPGTVMAINYVPNFINNQAVIEQAWISQYSEIVHANSRNQTYDATDLAMLTYAGIEVFAAIMHGVRAYGFMRQFSAENYLQPERFISAMHFDYADLKKNFSHMWQDIDQLIVQSRQIWIPNKMPIIERRMWMNSYIYTDADNTHGDYYMYVPATMYKYNSTLTTEGGGLELVKEWDVIKSDFSAPNSTGKTWQQYVDMVQSMIDALMPDQDRGIIYGDILKCYGREGIFALNQIDIGYTTTPTYNKEVLWQIENSTTYNAFPFQLRQTANGGFNQLWSLMTSTGKPNRGIDSFIMNFHQQESPTTEQIAIATRMMCGGNKLSDVYMSNGTKMSNQGFIPLMSGTEYPVFYGMYLNTVTGTTVSKTFRYTFSNLSIKTNSTDAAKAETLALLFAFARLDWAPLLYDGENAADGFWNATNIYGELDNWTPVNLNTIERIHIALTNSLYNVPTM